MSAPPVLVDRRGPIVLLTLNRPEVMNAVDHVVATLIGTALRAAEADPDVRVVVLTGAGLAFCAGGDLSAMQRGEHLHSHEHPEWGFGGMRHNLVDLPVIAAVNGAALGGGFEMCLACDLVVASERATFGLPEVRNGYPSNPAGSYRLMHQIPRKLALELILTGRAIDAAVAAQWGLVNRVVPHGQLLAMAFELAGEIAANDPAAVRTSKRSAYGVARGPMVDEATTWFRTNWPADTGDG